MWIFYSFTAGECSVTVLHIVLTVGGVVPKLGVFVGCKISPPSALDLTLEALLQIPDVIAVAD